MKLSLLTALLLSATAMADCQNDQPKPTTIPLSGDEQGAIPLSSILTTSPQKGMQHMRNAFPQKNGDQDSVVTNGYLQQIREATTSGASNVFLVDATNIHDAVRASFRVLVGAREANTAVPVDVPNPPRGSYWLVAYLGAGPSSPTLWTVERVLVQGNRVRLMYRESPPSPATLDIRHYYYWIPLGTLSPASYELELYDADRKAVSLIRRVEVEAVK